MYRLGGAAVAQFQTACCIDVVLHAEAWLKVEVCLYKLAALVVVCVCYVSVGIDVVVRRAAKRRVHVEAQTCRDVQFVANLPVVVNPDVVVLASDWQKLINSVVEVAGTVPVIAEFLGMQQDTSYLESDLEQSIIDNLQKFLMELGKGYAFVARQQRIHTEKEDY